MIDLSTLETDTIDLVALVLFVLVSAGLAAVWRRQSAPRADRESVMVGAAPAATPPAPPPDDPVGRIVHALRHRPWARRGLSVLSAGLIIGAVAMLGYPVYTNFYADRKQAQLERQLASPELRQAYLDGRVGEGDSLTRIRIPQIEVDTVVVEGVGSSALRAGAGHYPASALPCEDGNVAIAGHRTTYGKPFHNLDLLEVGDVILLETPVGSCSYEVSADPFIVSPHETEVVDNTPGDTILTLTTCHPKGSARQRLIVRAEMVSSSPVDA